MKQTKRSFLEEVTSQIKSKEAKHFVQAELNDHIEKSKMEWIKKGLSVEKAEEKAVHHMGSSVSLGQQMNKLHRPRVDWLLVILLAVCLGLGFLPLFSGEFVNVQNKVFMVLIGAAAAFALMLVDYRKLEKRGWMFYAAGVIILLMIHSFPNSTINGNFALTVGALSLESLTALPFFFLAWATFFNHENFKIWHCGLLFLFPVYLFFTLPSISSAYLYSVMVFAMLGYSKFSLRTILKIYGAAAVGLTFTMFLSFRYQSGYLKERMFAFLNPETYSDSSGFMILHLRKFLSEAGWFGSPSIERSMPDAATNFVFAALTSQFGWLFSGFLVIVLSLFAVRIAAVIPTIKGSYGRLLLIGAVSLYSIQVFSNIGMVLGFFPMTAMNLPFISYGLMPVLLNAVLIGIVLSVYRRKDLVSG
ncbi:FtsW/RodA/SpoVE family cell cycle protein [Peribacillus frigoritolerans]|uniref:FtsW/RodA/SpoVE family cell cycle protein n=1 Tax=Peribacillus frigoritolerans TaxID=450367 RepID=UPI00257022F7|nr:FtsW/RodA/SpoVE family cell cycle protein [Peribacillus frigoritolerans]